MFRKVSHELLEILVAKLIQTQRAAILPAFKKSTDHLVRRLQVESASPHVCADMRQILGRLGRWLWERARCIHPISPVSKHFHEMPET